jgi:hypothetical protein
MVNSRWAVPLREQKLQSFLAVALLDSPLMSRTTLQELAIKAAHVVYSGAERYIMRRGLKQIHSPRNRPLHVCTRALVF